MYISLCKPDDMETFSTFADLQAKYPISFDASLIIKKMAEWWGQQLDKHESLGKIAAFEAAVFAARNDAPAPAT